MPVDLDFSDLIPATEESPTFTPYDGPLANADASEEQSRRMYRAPVADPGPDVLPSGQGFADGALYGRPLTDGPGAIGRTTSEAEAAAMAAENTPEAIHARNEQRAQSFAAQHPLHPEAPASLSFDDLIPRGQSAATVNAQPGDRTALYDVLGMDASMGRDNPAPSQPAATGARSYVGDFATAAGVEMGNFPERVAGAVATNAASAIAPRNPATEGQSRQAQIADLQTELAALEKRAASPTYASNAMVRENIDKGRADLQTKIDALRSAPAASPLSPEDEAKAAHFRSAAGSLRGFAGEMAASAKANREQAGFTGTENDSLATKLGAGLGKVPDLLIPGAGLPLALGESRAEGYHAAYEKARTEGKSESEAIAIAESAANKEFARTAATLPLYMAGGSAASRAIDRVLPEATPGLLRTAANVTGQTGANYLTGAGTRALTGEEPFSLQSLPADIAFGILGGRHASAAQRARIIESLRPAERAPVDELARRALESRDAPSATEPAQPGSRDAPDLRTDAAAGRGEVGSDLRGNDQSAAIPSQRGGDTPQARAEAFLSGEADSVRFAPGEEIPAEVIYSGRPHTETPAGETVFFDSARRSEADFTGDQKASDVSDLNSKSLSPREEVTGDQRALKQEPTSTQNSVVDQERVSRGLEPIEPTAKQDFGTAWDKAKERLADEPTAGRDLVDVLNKKPRALTDEENALLLHRQIEAQTEFDHANDAAIKTPNEETKLRLNRALADLNEVHDATRAAGVETGRGLNARKMLAREDYSLASMMRKKSAANTGKPLSEKQTTEVRRAHERITELETKLANFEKRTAAAPRTRSNAIREARAEATTARRQRKSVTTFLDEQAEKARAHHRTSRPAQRRFRPHGHR